MLSTLLADVLQGGLPGRGLAVGPFARQRAHDFAGALPRAVDPVIWHCILPIDAYHIVYGCAPRLAARLQPDGVPRGRMASARIEDAVLRRGTIEPEGQS